MNLYLTKGIDGLYRPTDDTSYELSKGIGIGQSVEVKKANDRVVEYHRKFFAMIRFIHTHLPEYFAELYTTEESLRKVLLILSGHVKEYYMPDGTRHIEADSIRFDKVGQAEFRQIYEACINAAIKYLQMPYEIVEQLALNF